MTEYCCEKFEHYINSGDIITDKMGFYIKMTVRDSYGDINEFYRKMNYCLFCGKKL